MNRTPLHQHVDSLPALVRETLDPLLTAVRQTFTPARAQQAQRIFLTGCGDSYHAPLNAELAFEQLAGLPCEPMTAMQFARYAIGTLPPTGPGSNVVIAVSVSGNVSRTTEALRLAREAGALAVALTGNPAGTLAHAADLILETAVPPLPATSPDLIVPGARSYILSQLALYLSAIEIGQQRGHLSRPQANRLRRELAIIPDLMEQTIAACDAMAYQLAAIWQDATHYQFCGAGPNYGTAVYAAAKLLEASGDHATAQDTEEWAHLQYFGREQNTPTIIIGAGGWDEDRALEIATAAKAIGRRVAVIAPAGSDLAQTSAADFVLATAVPPRECFSPLITCLPGILFAAYRAQLLDEPYFRGFGGGRSPEGGGGISRIRTSHQINGIRR